MSHCVQVDTMSGCKKTSAHKATYRQYKDRGPSEDSELSGGVFRIGVGVCVCVCVVNITLEK